MNNLTLDSRVWVTLCGALSVAELAASLPHTGGWYVYLREGWGRLAGFLFGWPELVLIRASATGAVSWSSARSCIWWETR